MRRTVSMLALAALIAMPAFAQVQPPPPTPEQLAKVAEEDQLGDQKCGIPRNAADEYRPAPMTPDQTRAPRLKACACGPLPLWCIPRSARATFYPWPLSWCSR